MQVCRRLASEAGRRRTGYVLDPRLMVTNKMRTILRVETLSFGEAVGFIPQGESKWS